MSGEYKTRDTKPGVKPGVNFQKFEVFYRNLGLILDIRKAPKGLVFRRFLGAFSVFGVAGFETVRMMPISIDFTATS